MGNLIERRLPQVGDWIVVREWDEARPSGYDVLVDVPLRVDQVEAENKCFYAKRVGSRVMVIDTLDRWEFHDG